MTVKKYRKKPVVIKALLLEESVESQENAVKWCGGKKGPDGGVYIDTLEGKMYVSTGDYIIEGVNGEFYPCKSEIFEKKHTKVFNTIIRYCAEPE